MFFRKERQKTQYGGKVLTAYIVFGILFCAAGAVGILSLAGILSGTFIDKIRTFLQAVGGAAAYGVPVIALWTGLILLWSSNRYVSKRAYLLLMLIYLVALGLLNTTGSVGEYRFMDFLCDTAKQSGATETDGFSTMFETAYRICARNSNLFGGALGILTAWFFWNRFSSVLATVILAAIALILLALLFRFDLGKRFFGLFSHEKKDRNVRVAQVRDEPRKQNGMPAMQQGYPQQYPQQYPPYSYPYTAQQQYVQGNPQVPQQPVYGYVRSPENPNMLQPVMMQPVTPASPVQPWNRPEIMFNEGNVAKGTKTSRKKTDGPTGTNKESSESTNNASNIESTDSRPTQQNIFDDPAMQASRDALVSRLVGTSQRKNDPTPSKANQDLLADLYTEPEVPSTSGTWAEAITEPEEILEPNYRRPAPETEIKPENAAESMTNNFAPSVSQFQEAPNTAQNNRGYSTEGVKADANTPVPSSLAAAMPWRNALPLQTHSQVLSQSSNTVASSTSMPVSRNMTYPADSGSDEISNGLNPDNREEPDFAPRGNAYQVEYSIDDHVSEQGNITPDVQNFGELKELREKCEYPENGTPFDHTGVPQGHSFGHQEYLYPSGECKDSSQTSKSDDGYDDFSPRENRRQNRNRTEPALTAETAVANNPSTYGSAYNDVSAQEQRRNQNSGEQTRIRRRSEENSFGSTLQNTAAAVTSTEVNIEEQNPAEDSKPDFAAMFERLQNGEPVDFREDATGDFEASDTSNQRVPEKETDEIIVRPYLKPPIDLLDQPKLENMDRQQSAYIRLPYEQLQQDPSLISGLSDDECNAYMLEQMFASFHIRAKVDHVTHGPTVSRYEIGLLEQGVNINRISSLVKNIEMTLQTAGAVQIEEHIPNTNLFGVYVPNRKRQTVTFREILQSREMSEAHSNLSVVLGMNIGGDPVICDLSRMPHLLVAGTTGSGKSVCMNGMITSLLYRTTPEEVRIILIDPKMVEFANYEHIPHLLIPVVNDSHKASGALIWAVGEMEDRYARFRAAHVKTLDDYNAKLDPNSDVKLMPRIVIFIDELSDLMMTCQKEVEASIVRLAQKARAAGIHMVLATQRPEAKIVTGLIKSNVPSRIALKVSTGMDSRIILDGVGAEALLGNGDMLYQPVGLQPTRLQGCYLSDEESERIIAFIEKYNQNAVFDQGIVDSVDAAAKSSEKADQSSGSGEPSDGELDDRIEEAIDLALGAGQVSVSMLQRRLGVGYPRAGKMVDDMAELGIISQAVGNKPRNVLMTREEYERCKSALLGC